MQDAAVRQNLLIVYKPSSKWNDNDRDYDRFLGFRKVPLGLLNPNKSLTSCGRSFRQKTVSWLWYGRLTNNESSLLILKIFPTNQRFLKPPKTCDIYFFKRKTRLHITTMIRLISTLNPFWISGCNTPLCDANFLFLKPSTVTSNNVKIPLPGHPGKVHPIYPLLLKTAHGPIIPQQLTFTLKFSADTIFDYTFYCKKIEHGSLAILFKMLKGLPLRIAWIVQLIASKISGSVIISDDLLFE